MTDWMLHTALVPLSERAHLRARGSFCGSGSFMLSFFQRKRERQPSLGLSSKNNTPVCLCTVVPFLFSKDNKLFIYLFYSD